MNPRWTSNVHPVSSRAVRIQLFNRDGQPVTYAQVIESWQHDEEFIDFFCQVLSTSPFSAYRWETPPLARSNFNREFEFVLLNCPSLERTSDRFAFESHFNQSDIVTFANLGRDAILVAPCPVSEETEYGHLGCFNETANESQRRKLWQAVGKAMTQAIASEPVWLSTAGMGVAWLHVRLDSRPKYYGHAEYRTWH